MTTPRPNILPVCALAAIATLAVASQAMASTPVYSEDFNSYNTDANLIGQEGWARAGVPNSPSISTLPKGINTTPAVAKNLLATKDATAAELKRDPFKLPAAGIFSYEFDTQRDTGSSCTAAVGFGASASKGAAHVGINKGAFFLRLEDYGATHWIFTAPNAGFFATASNWYRIKVDINLATKELVGVSAKDLSQGDSKISDTEFQPLFIGKEGTARNLAGFFATDPTTWDEVFVRTGEQDAEGSGWIDNISATVAPASN